MLIILLLRKTDQGKVIADYLQVAGISNNYKEPEWQVLLLEIKSK